MNESENTNAAAEGAASEAPADGRQVERAPQAATRHSGERLTRIDWAAFVLTALGSAFMTSVMMKAPPNIGVWQDDGIYLVTSKSLAEGHGYRRPELPGNPWQTKYPILYPLVLSAIWRVWPAFPDNVAAIRVLHGVFTFVGVVLLHLTLRRAWRMSDRLAGAASVAAAISAGWTGVIETPMSEALFFPLMGLALWTASPGKREDAAVGRSSTAWGRALAGGSAAGAAYLTRTIGVSLIIALVASWLWRRRWREAACCAVLGAAAIAGWQWWVKSADAANASNPVRAALDYELNYGLWVPRDVKTAAWVGWQNTAAIAYSIYDAFLQTPVGGNEEPRLRGDLSGLPIYLPMIAATACILLGLATTLRRGAPAVHVFLLLYLMLTAIWPFPPNRFLLLIYPFLVAAILAGLFALTAAIARMFDARAESQPGLLAALRDRGIADLYAGDHAGARVGSGVALFVAAALVLHHVNILRYVAATNRTEAARNWASLAALIREKTPADAVIAAGHGGYLNLMTGRRFVLILPMSDPATLLYSEHRKYRHCGNTSSQAESGFIRKWVHDNLRAYQAAAGVGYALINKDMHGFNVLVRGEAQANRSYWPFVADHPKATLHRFVP